KIKQQTNFLKNFNLKLKLLKSSMDANSIDTNDIVELKYNKNEVSNINYNNAMNMSSNEDTSKRRRISHEEILSLFEGKNKRSMALQILKILESRDSASLDELASLTRMSKFQVIEMMNVLSKEKIVIK